MKEKEQSSVCVEEEKNGTNTAATITPSASKEIFDDSCFKAPLLLPPRKSVGRRRGSSLRNGQAINVDPIETKQSLSSMQTTKDVKDGTTSTTIPNDSSSCSCSQSYMKTLLIKDKIMMVKESIIDDFSLLMFNNVDDLQVFQDEVKAVKAKEEAEEKRRRYEENVRLGLIKRKGRKSKAQLEKERKLERRRLRREKKEQRRRDRRERRERQAREGTSIDSEERRLRKERKRERKERREREMRERELAGDEKLEKKERRRKLKDPNATTKKPPRQSRYSRSLGRIEAIPSEIITTATTTTTAIQIDGNDRTAVTWMNDTGISVCSANVANIGNQNNNALSSMLKRSSDLLIDGVGYEKRVKLESNHQEDHKNGIIGIATKTDRSAIMSGSPPRSGTTGVTRVNAIVTKVDMSNTGDNLGQAAWNGLQRTADTRDHVSSASVETTHPVDPGHDVPSTSVVAGRQQQQQTGVTAAPSINLSNLSSVNSLIGEPPGLPIGVLPSTGRNELSSVVTNATIGGTTNTDNRGTAGPPSAPLPPAPPTASLIDPFRQTFFGGTNLAALNAVAAAAAASGGTGTTIGGADFGNLFFPGAPPNAAAAFPFLAAQILQQQQTQQSMSLAQGTVPQTTLSAAAQPSTSAASSMGCIQFPSGTALSSQLANAALLGRTLPTAGAQPLSIKTKQGRWCAMHIKIAYEILSKKERRSTPQPSVVAAAVSQSSSSSSVAPSSQNNNNATTMRAGGCVTAPFCPPSTSNANMPSFSLSSGLPASFPALAHSGALSSPFTLPFQQLTDPSKLARQSATPKQPQGRSTTTISRSPTTSALHLQLGGGNTGSGAGNLMTPSMAVAAAAAAAAGGTMTSLQGSLPSALPGVLGSSLPLAPNLPGATASLTNGTSEAAAQAAMFAALQNAQQNAAAALPNGSLSSAPYLLSSTASASAQPHPLSAVTSQAQSVYSSQRLFDPNMAAVLQQMHSMEALRQSAAAQMTSNAAAATGAHVPVSGAPQPQSQPPPPSSLDLVRMQMEQQMMDRYMVALSNASGMGSNTSMTPTANLELMRQQLFAAQMRQQQSQPSLEALLEMQRQQHQQQQQQLYNASRGLPSTYSLTGATPPGGIPGSAAAVGLPQSLGAAAGLFNSNLMSLGNAAAAANLQQALYSGKNPYSNTLEQLARQKREEDIMQSGR